MEIGIRIIDQRTIGFIYYRKMDKVGALISLPPKSAPSRLSYSQVLDRQSRGSDKKSATKVEEEEWITSEDEDVFRFVQPRRLSSWVHDDAVSKCFKCAVPFSLLIRKHHCRSCGRIFCNDCSNQRIVIPSDFALLRPEYGISSTLTSTYDYLCSNSYAVADKKENVIEEYSIENKREREKFITSIERLQEHYPECVKGFTPNLGRKKSINELYVPEGSSAQRVCKGCASSLYQRRQHQHTVKVLELCEFDIFELRILGQVCRKWHRASILCLSNFRQIQYYLPTHALSEREKRLLRINCTYLTGHSKWLVQLIKANDWKDGKWTEYSTKLLSKPRVNGCMMTMCSRLCRQKFSPVDAFEIFEKCLLLQQQQDEMNANVNTKQSTTGLQNTIQTLTALAVSAMKEATNQEWISFLPMLLHYLQNIGKISHLSPLGEIILQHATEDDAFRNDLYWDLSVRALDGRYTRLLDGFKQRLLLSTLENVSKQAAEQILRGQELVHIFGAMPPRLPNADARCILRQLVDKADIFNKSRGPLLLPLDPAISITSLKCNAVDVKASAEAPMIVPCVGATRNGIPCKYKVMYKKDDLRKDSIVQNIIATMYTILKQETNMDVHVVTYRVLPTSNYDGFIQIVQNAETLYTITKDYGSIMHFLHRYNGSRTMKEIKNSFRESLAAYTVITFLLGVGDRHADNVMLTKDGILFHIDYGFILGKDPKPLQPPMRLDSHMIEALGGAQNIEFGEFKELCVVAFNCLRRHVGLFQMLLTFVVKATPEINEFEGSDNGYTLAELEAFIVERFLPGQSDEEAATALTLRMEGKLNERIGQSLSDFVHAHANEQTVSRSMSTVGETMNSVAYSLSSGASNIFNYVIPGSRS